MNPYSYAHLIFDKVPKTYHGEKIASFMNVAKKSGYPFTMYQIYHTSIHPLY
jgi:hypothetical protein